MSRAAARARLLAVLCLGLLLLAATQPWWSLLVELAPGLPRTPRQLSPGAAGVASACAVVAALALLGCARRPTPPLRLLAVLATAGVLAATLVAGRSPGHQPVTQVVDAARTGWYAVAGTSALLATLLVLAAEAAGSVRRKGPDTTTPRLPAAPADRDEAERRRVGRAWTELDGGGDPTLDP